MRGWWLCVGVLALSCSKTKTKAPEVKRQPVGSASAAPTASAAPKPGHVGPVMKLVRKFPNSEFFPVGNAGIVCSAYCSFYKGAKPKLWLVTADKVEPAPLLWPSNAYQKYLPTMEEDPDTASSNIVFWGKYPDGLFAMGESSDPPWPGLPTVKFVKKYWAEASNAPRRPEEDHKFTSPRRLDRALMTVPVSSSPLGRLIYGGGGPVLLVEKQKLYSWDGKRWSVKPAPWQAKLMRTRRLMDGGTLVRPDKGLYYVSKDLVVERIELPGAGDAATDFHAIAGTVWVESGDMSKLLLYRPEHPERVRFAKIEERAEPKPRPAPPPPRVEAGAEAGAEAGGAVRDEMPAPTKLTDKCTTPFVILATPPGPGGYYDTIPAAFKGHMELTDKVTFVEYVRKGQTWFGAQTVDADTAHKVASIVKSRFHSIKPQLACLDAKKHIPDPYNPPPGMRIVWIHLGCGGDLGLK